MRGVKLKREAILKPEEKIMIACSVPCTSAECTLVATIAFCTGLINVFYANLPPLRQFTVCPTFQYWQGFVQLILQTSYFFPQVAAQTQAAYMVI